MKSKCNHTGDFIILGIDLIRDFLVIVFCGVDDIEIQNDMLNEGQIVCFLRCSKWELNKELNEGQIYSAYLKANCNHAVFSCVALFCICTTCTSKLDSL